MNISNFCRGAAALLASASFIVPIPARGQNAEQNSAEQENRRDIVRANEIIVTARSLSSPDMPTATPVQVLSGDELAHRRQGGLGETLAGLPGIHLDNFGGGASRPVIRGQTVPRIEILSDGANLFDASSVSPDHAITTDPLLLDGIEILRGPAAARYGGNATNGAINLIDSKVPKVLPEGGLSGATEVRYGTGDKEKAIAGRVTAAVGPFAIHAEGSRHVAEDYDVPDSYGSDKLCDSFAEGSSYAFGASWVTDKGYIGAAYTRQESEYGLPGHSHVGAACHFHVFEGPNGMDMHCVSHGGYGSPINTPDDLTAFIRLKSDRYDLRADFEDLLPGFSHLRLRGSYTDYMHDEIDGPTLFSHYTNEVWDGRIELTHKPLLGFTGTLGVQYTRGTFGGLDHIADLALPVTDGWDGKPDYITENIGVFLSERRSFGPIDIEIAARKDWRTITVNPAPYRISLTEEEAPDYGIPVNGPNWREEYMEARRADYLSNFPPLKPGPLSASAAATWNLSDGYALSLAFGHTERAPSVRELYAGNSSLATNSFEMGLSTDLTDLRNMLLQYPDYFDPDLVALLPSRSDHVLEKTDAINLTFRKTTGATQFEIGVFHQRVENYIYARLLELDSETGVALRWLAYVPADANFTGIDGQISHQFTPSSRLMVFGDYVHAKLKSEDDNLPRIPPGRLGARYEGNWGPLSADLEYYHTFAQNRFASYETRTGGYNMVNATLAYRFDVGLGKSVEFYARGTNLTNELAFSHTSFVKNQSPLRGRSIAIGMRHAF